MKKIILYILCSLVLLHTNAQGQDCDAAAIMNIKGKWTTTADNIIYPDKTFPASQYNQLRTRIDKIALLFKEAYPEPAGMEAKWWRCIDGSAIVKNGPVPYRFESAYFSWYCNQKLHKVMQSSDFNAWVAVSVNGLGHILDDQNGQLWIKIDGAAAYLLPQTKEQWNGLPVYERIGSYTKSKCVLITHNDQLPYKPVSRLSYLQSLKQKIETDKQEQINVLNKIPVKTEAEEEAAKQRGMQNATYGAAANRIEERKANYLKNYKTDKQQREESRQTTAKYFDDKLKIIDDILKNFGNDYLQQPAIIDNNSNFKGFATLENGGRMIVVIDPGYFNSQLPRYMPQLFVLYWQWDKSPASQNIKKLVEENFSIDKLKAMLDK